MPVRSAHRRLLDRSERRVQRVLRMRRSGEPSAFFRTFALMGLGPGFERGRPEPSQVTEFMFVSPWSSLGAVNSVFQPTVTLPQNASMVWLMCGGAGGPGGNGHTGATSTNKTGGGGGGSGGISSLFMPVRFCPQPLYCQPGECSPVGNVGADSWITQSLNAAPASPVDYVLQAIGGSNGGAGGTTSAGAAGGAAAALNIDQIDFVYGLSQFIGGQAGGAGGADTPGAGVSVTWGATGRPFTGGAGGGSASSGNSVSAGGNITPAGRLGMTVTGGGGVIGGPGGAGQSGYTVQRPGFGFAAMGGAGGGGAASAGVGGAGGAGGLCCGGGGGGAGVTGGAAGIGGPGFCYVAWW